jgi:NAD(P)-dependent dehydrogenase (short-subunit alcohol dehydrogenase family)
MALTLGLLPSLKAAGEADGVAARVIMTSSDIGVTSACGFFGAETFDESFMHGSGEGNLRGERLRGNGKTRDSLAAYGRAKLCNILFAFELNRRLKSKNIPVIAHAVHTGAVATGPARAGVSSVLHKMPFPGVSYLLSNVWTPLLWRTPEEGARTLLFGALATEPAGMAKGGQYASALCRPYLDNVDGDEDELVPLKLWGNTTLHIHRTRRKALQSADKRWSERLWEVSLDLLANSPARELVKEAL